MLARAICAGRTAPIAAYVGGHVLIARLLVKAGADNNLARNEGMTALMLASAADDSLTV